MLNLKNTLDGYLKNVEVIGNTVQDTNNLADIRSVGDKVEGQELYNISIQVDNGKGVSEVVEILSPVQLEKVGVIADRIICKDGIWGVEKHSKSVTVKGDETVTIYQTRTNVIVYKVAYADLKSEYSNNIISNKFIAKKDITGNHDVEGICVYTNDNIYISINKSRLTTQDVKGFSTWLKENDLMVKYPVKQPQFIPLPYDQQVKLRTFAGQTNIAFLTEIPGQVKAQVPKSLGATVNTHTEQIKDLHNSLDRVKKLEETTVSTIETESGFTTVDATNNGYFEDVKLEGKTLVNLCTNKSNWGGNTSVRFSTIYLNRNFELNKIYTLCVVNPPTNFDNMMFRYDVDNTIFHSIKNTVATFKLSNILEVSPVLYLYGENLGEATNTEVIILEGDHTNNPPGYYKGLMSVGQDVEEVSVESANKNLFNGSVKNQTVNTNGIIASDEKARSTDFIKVPNDYDITISVKILNQDRCAIVEYDANKQFIKFNNATSLLSNGVYTFKTDKNTKYIIYYYNSSTQIADEDVPNYIMVNVGTELNPYILYQSNKKPLLYYNPSTETWKKPVLREWDTIEKHSDGKYYYHKRSGEIVLSGSGEYIYNNYGNNFDGSCISFRVKLNSIVPKTGALCMSDYGFSLSSAPTQIGKAFDDEYIHFMDNGNIYFTIQKDKLTSLDNAGVNALFTKNPIKLVFELKQEEIYECTNIDLMTYSGETNYIINSGAISPKSLLKVHNNISNVVKILQEKVSLLENTFIAGLKSVLSGDMYSLATILYPEDFEQNDNTEQDIMVIPE